MVPKPRLVDLPDIALSERQTRVEDEVRRVVTSHLVAERKLAQLRAAREQKPHPSQEGPLVDAVREAALTSRHLGGMKQAFRALGIGRQVDSYIRVMLPYLREYGYGPVRIG